MTNAQFNKRFKVQFNSDQYSIQAIKFQFNKVSTPNRKTRRAVRSVTRKSKTNKVSLDNWNLSYTIDRSKSKYKNSKLKLKERIAIPIYSCDAESFNDEQIREDLLNLFTQEELNDAFNCPDDIDYSTHPIVVKKYYDKCQRYLPKIFEAI